MGKIKLSYLMQNVLERIAGHEAHSGRAADPDLYPTRTVLSLNRRGLIERLVDGSVMLTDRGCQTLGVVRLRNGDHVRFVESD